MVDNEENEINYQGMVNFIKYLQQHGEIVQYILQRIDEVIYNE